MVASETLWKITFMKFKLIWHLEIGHVTLNFLKANFQKFIGPLVNFLSHLILCIFMVYFL